MLHKIIDKFSYLIEERSAAAVALVDCCCHFVCHQGLKFINNATCRAPHESHTFTHTAACEMSGGKVGESRESRGNSGSGHHWTAEGAGLLFVGKTLRN